MGIQPWGGNHEATMSVTTGATLGKPLGLSTFMQWLQLLTHVKCFQLASVIHADVAIAQCRLHRDMAQHERNESELIDRRWPVVDEALACHLGVEPSHRRVFWFDHVGQELLWQLEPMLVVFLMTLAFCEILPAEMRSHAFQSSTKEPRRHPQQRMVATKILLRRVLGLSLLGPARDAHPEGRMTVLRGRRRDVNVHCEQLDGAQPRDDLERREEGARIV